MIALRVVQRVVLEGSLAVLVVSLVHTRKVLEDSLAVLVASLVVLLVVSLVHTRKVPAWRRSTNYYFFSFLAWHLLSFP
jgi:hypothetical protein